MSKKYKENFGFFEIKLCSFNLDEPKAHNQNKFYHQGDLTMSKIKIVDLQPTKLNQFAGLPSYLQDLSESEQQTLQGGLMQIAGFALMSLGAFGFGVAIGYHAAEAWHNYNNQP